MIAHRPEWGRLAWSNFINTVKISSTVLRKFPHIQIYIPWLTKHARYQCNKNIIDGFSTFESMYLKYLKSLQSGHKFELRISDDMWQHDFIYEVRSYIFIFLVTCIVYILFLVLCGNCPLLLKKRGVFKSTVSWFLIEYNQPEKNIICRPIQNGNT